MSEFSDEMAQVAVDLITEFGESATFARSSLAPYDPATGEGTSGPTTTSYGGYCFPNRFPINLIDGVNILHSDIQIYCHRMTQEPVVGDSITFDGNTYQIMDVKNTRTNGVNVLYTLQARR